MKKNFIVGFMCLTGAVSAFGWGQKGHDIVAYIAQKHLTPATQAAVDSLFDGYSLVYWSNWLDNASHTEEYEYTKTWHYKNIDANKTFENAPKIKEGNIVDAIYDQVEVLRSDDTSKDDKVLALKIVVHLLGDIHQPMHLGREKDKGGNRYSVRFFKGQKNLHSVWDSFLPNASHSWSHTEWQEEIDRLSPEKQVEIVAGGNPDVWGKETYEICKEIYDTTAEETNIEYDYISKWTPTIEMQYEKGGLRLADLLNSVFDPEYTPLNSFVK